MSISIIAVENPKLEKIERVCTNWTQLFIISVAHINIPDNGEDYKRGYKDAIKDIQNKLSILEK